MRSITRTLTATLLSFAFLIGFSIWFVNKYFWLEAHSVIVRWWPTPTAEQVETKHLRRIAGWFSLDCGHVRHHENADRAISCADDALRRGRPFYVSFDYIGIDSHGTTGLAADSKHELYEVVTDELGRGSLGHVATTGTVRTTNVSRCEKSPVEETSLPANRYLTCHPSSPILPD
jgi:hypothetical protein